MDPSATQVPTPPVTPETPPKAPTRSKKFPLIMLITLLIAVLTLTATTYTYYTNPELPQIFLSPTPTPTQPTPTPTDLTANWKAYTDQKFGFEFKYPESKNAFLKLPYYDETTLLHVVLSDKNGGITQEDSPVFIHPWPDFNITISKSLNTEKQLTRNEKVKTNDGVMEYTPITFANNQANKIVQKFRPNTEPYILTTIIFNAKGYGWQVSFVNLDEKGNYSPVYDQILSTFRFD